MSDLMPVEEALARVLDGIRPLESELVALDDSAGRVLAQDLVALRTHPDFDASAMDGYAVRMEDAAAGVWLRVVGQSAAGHAFPAALGPGEVVRVFTGGLVPLGADAILIQENAQLNGSRIEVLEPPRPGQHIRQRGLDFQEGAPVLPRGARLGSRALMLAAAANHAELPLVRRPVVAILATGDELVPPGSPLEPGQIVASNTTGIAALVRAEGGIAIDLGLVGDSHEALADRLGRARTGAFDVLVTIGGASVGDHDLIAEALRRQGFDPAFWRIAMRPGKPLMYGRLDGRPVLGLPGNPVSAYVCSILFLLPLLRTLLGRDDVGPSSEAATLGVSLPANDKRQDYLRACRSTSRTRPGSGKPEVRPLRLQDSSMTTTLMAADCLIIRRPFAPAAEAGDDCEIIDLSPTGL